MYKVDFTLLPALSKRRFFFPLWTLLIEIFTTSLASWFVNIGEINLDSKIGIFFYLQKAQSQYLFLTCHYCPVLLIEDF